MVTGEEANELNDSVTKCSSVSGGIIKTMIVALDIANELKEWSSEDGKLPMSFVEIELAGGDSVRLGHGVFNVKPQI